MKKNKNSKNGIYKFFFDIYNSKNGIYKFFFDIYNSLNNSKLLFGLAMIVLNLLSKHIELGLSKTQEAYIKNAIGREILIFTIIFINTRDIFISLIVTASFIILANTVFHEDSRYCLMNNKYKELKNVIDTNNDGFISDSEINAAKELLLKAAIQK